MTAPWAPFVSELPREYIRETLAEIRNPFEIAFYHSKNGFNFSASMRTGHSFLCSGYHKIDIERTYDKAAMVAKRFDGHLVQDWADTKAFINGTQGRNLVAMERKPGLNSQDLRDFTWPENPIMLFGTEGEGLPDDLIEASEHVVHIPMAGLVASLNVACAAGITMFHWYDQFMKVKF